MNDQPIAVFDSGLGGLTVVRALQKILPNEAIVYFGDTARIPYGIKSSVTIVQFAEQDIRFLLRFDPKLVVAACNTASALALDEVAPQFSVPVVGVVKPGAAAAVEKSRGRPVAVLATESTVESGAYERAIHELMDNIPVTQRACTSLVSLIEEGRDGDDPILRMLLSEYLDSVRGLDPAVVLLGCTHYPLVQRAVSDLMPDAQVVDSAEATARSVHRLLADDDALSSSSTRGRLQCYVSDNPQRFREVGSRFLGEPIRDVTRISPEQFFHENLLPAGTDDLDPASSL